MHEHVWQVCLSDRVHTLAGVSRARQRMHVFGARLS